MSQQDDLDVAIIGMACRFPQANTIPAFWQLLCRGLEAITPLSDKDLEAAGVSPSLLHSPHYVKACAPVEGIEYFDAAFFGYSPQEARLMDPQQRLFLECSWEALEGAGYINDDYQGTIGVYASVGVNHYLLRHLVTNAQLLKSAGNIQLFINNDKDFLATRVSYKLNLKGPSITVQTACSSSAVAVHLAYQDIVSGACDIALAGGVSLTSLQKVGYLYEEGGILSPDGHCRAFDAKAQGSVFGNGAGIVVLKKLAEAVANRDTIYAVIKGTAINNDGSMKVGFTAPGIEGQAKVIRTAQFLADVDPESITYVETHGSGTLLGDPIEIAALTSAFRNKTEKCGFCAIGSVKTNIGHLDVAAGVAGLIKTALALKHKRLPPSLNFTEPNPDIDFAASPFYVNTTLTEWRAGATPRRAGVSSFGLGGTNVHMILEEAPESEPVDLQQPWHLLVFSAKTPAALERSYSSMEVYLRQEEQPNSFADIAYTLQTGRRAFPYRCALVCRDRHDALQKLAGKPSPMLTGTATSAPLPIVFLFPGLGDQYVGMARHLYASEPFFRSQVDLCCELIQASWACDLRTLLYTDEDGSTHKSRDQLTSLQPMLLNRHGFVQSPPELTHLDETRYAHPAIFIIEYALAKLWMRWGIVPQALLGYSLGEYTAACLAGVFSLPDALWLIVKRAHLIEKLAGGSMLAIAQGKDELQPLLGPEISFAAYNGPHMTVVVGPSEATIALQQALYRRGIAAQYLRTRQGFHSAMMSPLRDELTRAVASLPLHPPEIPFLSNLTGRWITIEQAVNPSYWAQHLCEPVRFVDNLTTLLSEHAWEFLEVGPGRTLGTLVRQHSLYTPQSGSNILPSLPASYEGIDEVSLLLTSLGKLWCSGHKIDWHQLHTHELRRRLPLPTYPFEHQKYWIPPSIDLPNQKVFSGEITKKENVADWFYMPGWKRAILPLRQAMEQKIRLLLLMEESELSSSLLRSLAQFDCEIVKIYRGKSFKQVHNDEYIIDQHDPSDYLKLINSLAARFWLPQKIVHLWGVTLSSQCESIKQHLEDAMSNGTYSLLFLTQALGKYMPSQQVQIDIVARRLFMVESGDIVCPELSTIVGPCKVISQEYPAMRCRIIDIAASACSEEQSELLLTELMTPAKDFVVAYRGIQRWVQIFDAVQIESSTGCPIRLRKQGVYLITGGLGRVGLALAEYLASHVQAQLVLLGRSSFPSRDTWSHWLATHEKYDQISIKINTIQELETKTHTNIVVSTADVADKKQMETVVAQIVEHYGQLNGIIHAAGDLATGAFTSIATTGRHECERHFHPKVYGLYTLSQVTAHLEVDFYLLVSSLSPILGGIGMFAYAAANQFMDAFAHEQGRRLHTRWFSINWADWQPQLREGQEHQYSAIGATVSKLEITTEEGIETFRRILSCTTVPQLIISSGDLQARLEQWVNLAPLQRREQSQFTPEALLNRTAMQGGQIATEGSAIEQQVIAVWQELLGIEQIKVEDNFFALGGNSLLGIQLLACLRSLFQIDISIHTIFEDPTVSGTVQAIMHGLAQQPVWHHQYSGLTARPSGEPALPSSFQEHLWFMHQLMPNSPAYNVHAAVHITGHFHLDVFEKTCERILQRHEVLRTTFALEEGRLVPVIRAHQHKPLVILDLCLLSDEERTYEVEHLIQKEVHQPFDLHRGPLLRVIVLLLKARECIVILGMHHIVSDAWSANLLIHELIALYPSIRDQRPDPLPDLPFQYADFAYWQKQFQEGYMAAELDYWVEQLSGAPPFLQLPTDYPRPPLRSLQGAQQKFALSTDLRVNLKTLSLQEGVTLFMVLLTAFYLLLAHHSEQDDIIIGIDHANRSLPGTEKLLGSFVNIIPLRLDLSGHPSFRQLLGRVRKVALAGFEHHRVPFYNVIEALQLKRNLSHAPLFQVIFNFQNIPAEALVLEGLRFQPLPLWNDTAKFDLALFMEEQEEELTGMLVYSTDLFAQETIIRFIEHFKTLLDSIVARPDAQISDLQILPEEERQRLLLEKEAHRHVSIQRLKQIKRKPVEQP